MSSSHQHVSDTTKRREVNINNISEHKWRWLLFTVLFGLIPILLRLLVSALISGEEHVAALAPADFIAFGIVLQVSIFNEMKYHDLNDVLWKQLISGFSTLLLLVYGTLYVMALLSEVIHSINLTAILCTSTTLSMISFLLCLAVYDRMTIAKTIGEQGDD